MRFCSFGAPLILLTGQVTLISTVFTPDQIITRFSTAISNIINAIGDASAITADNPTVDYNTIVTNSDNIGNELNEDNNDIQGTPSFPENAENMTVLALGGLTNALVKYFGTLQVRAPDFVDPAQKSAIVASGTALEKGAECFVDYVTGLTENVELHADDAYQMSNMIDSFDAFTDVYRYGV